MPKGILLLIVLLLLIVGGCVMLAGRNKEQPLHTIESNVACNAAG